MQRIAAILALVISLSSAQAFSGATVAWTTCEAENMATTGTVLGPQYGPNVVASESSGRKCVQLNATGQYVQFTAQAEANAIVVRYSVPDSADGVGTDSTISLYKNGVFVAKLPVTSKYSWLYGAYPFSNTPGNGSPRNFYDEIRTNGLSLTAGDVVRLQKNAEDTASYYIIDLVDLENVAAPLTAPANSLSIMSYGAGGTGATDDTTALANCIAAASGQGKSVWLPAGSYKITASVNLPSNITIQGAGMWHTTLVGDPTLYTTSARRITLNGNGSNIHLSDFAIAGKLNYRNDSEPNDGLGGKYGTGSTISRVWVEHTKTGAWIVNSQGLVVDSCRFRNTIADGINVCVGMRSTTVTNCTARGTGDDCFAIWAATYIGQNYAPGLNVITHCTGQLAFLANGGAIYGGESNRIEDCLFQDLPYGCGILISTTFPVGNNGFSGTTVAQRCDLNRCGGYDPGWTWRAALQLCLENKSLSGVNLNNLNITNSISDGLSIVAPGSNVGSGLGALSNATMVNVSIPNYGIGASGRHGLWARSDAIGSMTVSNSTVVEYRNDSANFTFNFVIGVTVQPNPAGRSFTVDGTAYTTAQTFTWTPGSSHTIAASSPQSGGTGVQYVWSSWNDGGAISHTITPTTNTTYTADFTTQYYLTMNAGTGGSVSPGSDWTNSGANVNASATASDGYSFSGWTGSGSGSYSGNNNPAPITMNGPITETASFALIATRLMSLSGDLAFGNVTVGSSGNRTLTIGNSGDSALTVGAISYPGGFSGDWSGAIPSGGSTNLTVTFSPNAATNYSGDLTVNSDATGGSNTLSVSGVGVLRTNEMPLAQNILAVSVNGDASVTLTYAVTPGFPYRIETATNLSPSAWTTVTGSATNAAANTVTFTDLNPPGGGQRYYRTSSP
jgi:Pectate lyase superfamily protein/Divergent InlB B-repeat domain/Abnormal spindle-like microcephaly-assoc'd, ASPM-SPD-2-Hydin